MARPRIPLSERIARRTQRSPNGCLLWTGAREMRGYGKIRVNGEYRRTHRVAWELAHGPIPDGKIVLHSCDTPPCLELSHLRLGTDADNSRDRVERGRARGKPARPGEEHPEALLTAEAVRYIRTGSERAAVLAARYGTCPATIDAARYGATWKHLNAAVPPAKRPGRRLGVQTRRILTWAIVDEIRASSESARVLAARYGVCRAAVSHVRQGRTWPERCRPTSY